MQIMIYLDNMLFLPSIQQYPLLITLAHILPTWGLFTHHPQTPAEVSQMLPTLTIPGMAHQYLVICPLLMLFLAWIFIIMVGSTIHLHFLQLAVVLVVQISLLFRLLVRDHLEPAPICPDRGLLCIHSLLVTGIPSQIWMSYFIVHITLTLWQSLKMELI